MKALNLITLALIIIGGVNWLLVGVADLNLVAMLFGDGTLVSRIVYVLVGLSALYQLAPFFRSFRVGEVTAEGGMRTTRS